MSFNKSFNFLSKCFSTLLYNYYFILENNVFLPRYLDIPSAAFFANILGIKCAIIIETLTGSSIFKRGF